MAIANDPGRHELRREIGGRTPRSPIAAAISLARRVVNSAKTVRNSSITPEQRGALLLLMAEVALVGQHEGERPRTAPRRATHDQRQRTDQAPRRPSAAWHRLAARGAIEHSCQMYSRQSRASCRSDS